ncbi:MAG: glutamyl-tRNA reductase [Syntrophomonadaceae bacterium]|nr:glutamyl-tRNA reductase [Syntrophomonadaceae bacterium]
MYVLLAGLNHRTAPVEIRERFSICGADLDRAYQHLKESRDIESSVILTTCNRTEVYAAVRNIQEGTLALEGFLASYANMESDILKKYLYQPNCYDAILHLFRVASGLDSMIVGEAQIIGQVKDAHQKAMEADSSDGVLNALFQKAIYVGKRVRTDTDIDKHQFSISHAAVELAKNILGSLEDKTVMVIGAGEMSELTTKYLMLNGVNSVIVSNRSYEKAVIMAESFNGRAVRFEQLTEELSQADIVISCTAASHYVIREENCQQVLESRNGRKIIMIDIAVPRDIDPGLKNIPGVFIYDIDKLQNVVNSNYLERQKAVLEADRIIVEEIAKFNEWLASLYVVPVITALKNQGEIIKQNEIKRACNRLGIVSEQEQKVISSMATSIVNQLLHFPIINLKEMATSNQGHLYAEIVKKLFALQIDNKEDEKYEKFEIGNQR